MKNVNFFNFCLLLSVSMTIAVFNSCSKDDDNKSENTNGNTNDNTNPNGVLINGVVWAKCNVDEPGAFAATPESFGMLYQWNRVDSWPITNDVYVNEYWWTTNPDGITWEKSNDPSPDGWRVPTLDEIKSLLDETKVKNEKFTQNGVLGCKFTDKATGKSIFLPSVGDRAWNTGRPRNGGYGRYWSSEPNGTHSAYILIFHDNPGSCSFCPHASYMSSDRCYGTSIRPVEDK